MAQQTYACTIPANMLLASVLVKSDYRSLMIMKLSLDLLALPLKRYISSCKQSVLIISFLKQNLKVAANSKKVSKHNIIYSYLRGTFVLHFG